MNSKQLFFVSLIILSIAMGLNWFKNRAKFVKKQPPVRTRQAVSLNDLQLQENSNDKEDEEEDEEEDDKKEEKADKENKNDNKKYEGEVNEEGEGEGGEGDNEADDNKEKKEENGENEIKPPDSNASDSIELLASDSHIIDSPLKDDPIMQDYFKMTRNPFETSPYAQLVEKLRLEAEIAAQPVVVVKEKIKVPKLLASARFSGTIETARGPKAIIDGGLYENGNEYNNYVIKEVKMNYIILESQDEEWLLPKTGVDIKIDQETGKYTVTDSYE